MPRRRLVLVSLAAVAVVLAVVLAVRGFGETAPGRAVYLYDTEAGKLVVGDLYDFQSDPGSRVVAHVFGCGGCGDDTARFIGYLESEQDGVAMVRRESDTAWTPLNTEAGLAIADAAEQRCDGDLVPCDPPG